MSSTDRILVSNSSRQQRRIKNKQNLLDNGDIRPEDVDTTLSSKYFAGYTISRVADPTTKSQFRYTLHFPERQQGDSLAPEPAVLPSGTSSYSEGYQGPARPSTQQDPTSLSPGVGPSQPVGSYRPLPKGTAGGLRPLSPPLPRGLRPTSPQGLRRPSQAASSGSAPAVGYPSDEPPYRVATRGVWTPSITPPGPRSSGHRQEQRSRSPPTGVGFQIQGPDKHFVLADSRGPDYPPRVFVFSTDLHRTLDDGRSSGNIPEEHSSALARIQDAGACLVITSFIGRSLDRDWWYQEQSIKQRNSARDHVRALAAKLNLEYTEDIETWKNSGLLHRSSCLLFIIVDNRYWKASEQGPHNSKVSALNYIDAACHVEDNAAICKEIADYGILPYHVTTSRESKAGLQFQAFRDYQLDHSPSSSFVNSIKAILEDISSDQFQQKVNVLQNRRRPFTCPPEPSSHVRC